MKLPILHAQVEAKKAKRAKESKKAFLLSFALFAFFASLLPPFNSRLRRSFADHK
jgi:hypothetical protein